MRTNCKCDSLLTDVDFYVSGERSGMNSMSFRGLLNGTEDDAQIRAFSMTKRAMLPLSHPSVSVPAIQKRKSGSSVPMYSLVRVVQYSSAVVFPAEDLSQICRPAADATRGERCVLSEWSWLECTTRKDSSR